MTSAHHSSFDVILGAVRDPPAPTHELPPVALVDNVLGCFELGHGGRGHSVVLEKGLLPSHQARRARTGDHPS